MSHHTQQRPSGKRRRRRWRFRRRQADIGLAQLFFVDWAGGSAHQISPALRLGESDYITNVSRVAENHDHPIQPQRNRAVWRSAELQGVQQTSKFLPLAGLV